LYPIVPAAVRVQSGEHEGKTAAELLIQDPGRAWWLVTRAQNSNLRRSLRLLIKRLDERPFVSECETCRRRADKVVVLNGSTTLLAWCSSCPPYRDSIRSNVDVSKFYRAMAYAERNKRIRPAGVQRLVLQLAEAKGLKTTSRAALMQFFRAPPSVTQI
jgi:hypothetical protein